MSAFYPLEYITILKRRAPVFMTVFVLFFLAGLAVTLNWSKYSASATIEVAQPEISMDALISNNGQSISQEALADLQISRLKQKVLSTSSLGEIIAKLNLYPEARQSTPITRIARNMRRHVSINLQSTALANPASAQKASAIQLSAIAFTVSFEYDDPSLAQKTVNELVSRFLDEDLRERREMAGNTSDFLEGQITILSQSLEQKEKEIAEFRAENGGMRADALNFNQQASIASSTRLLNIDSELTANLGRIGALRAQLASTEPYLSVVDDVEGEIITPPAVRLRALESEFAALTSRYGRSHPDVISVERQIRALKKQVPGRNANMVIDDADNPSYLQILAQLTAAEKQQEALEAQREFVRQQQEDFQQAIIANPEAEQRLSGLSRDYDNMMALYRELKGRKLAADMNLTIEEGHSGRRLAVIDPPELPLSTSPSRKLLFVVSVMVAGIAAISMVLGLYLLSPTVIGPNHVESLIGTSPLVRIPRLKTYDERITLRRIVMLVTLIAVVFGGLVLASSLLSIPVELIQGFIG